MTWGWVLFLVNYPFKKLSVNPMCCVTLYLLPQVNFSVLETSASVHQKPHQILSLRTVGLQKHNVQAYIYKWISKSIKNGTYSVALTCTSHIPLLSSLLYLTGGETSSSDRWGNDLFMVGLHGRSDKSIILTSVMKHFNVTIITARNKWRYIWNKLDWFYWSDVCRA